jgi:hypothetical protein
LTLLCVVKRYFMIEFWLGDWVVGGQVPWSEGGSGVIVTGKGVGAGGGVRRGAGR